VRALPHRDIANEPRDRSDDDQPVELEGELFQREAQGAR
jgi:hypothetical protein